MPPHDPEQLHLNDVDRQLVLWHDLLLADKLRTGTPIRMDGDAEPFARVSGLKEKPEGGFTAGIHFLRIDPTKDGGFYGYSQLVGWDDEKKCLIVSKPATPRKK